MDKRDKLERSQLRGYLIVAPWEVTTHGGVNGVIRNLSREMQYFDRFAPLIVECSWRHKRTSWRTDAGIPIASLRLRSPVAERKQALGLRNLVTYLITLPVITWQILQILKQYQVGVINIHYPGMTALTFIILKRLGLFRGTVILSFHGSDVRWGLSLKGLRRRLWTWTLNGADAMVAVSQQLANSIIEQFPCFKSKLSVVYNGVELKKFVGVREKAALSGEEVVLVSVASYDLIKGVDILLRAFSKIKPIYPNIRLSIIGESGNDDEFLQKLSRELGLASSVEWHTDVDHKDIPALLAVADIFVLASRSEAFGIVLLEAGASGLPVIATRVGGVPELIRDGYNGLLVDPVDPDALANAIIWAVNNRDLALDMSRKLSQLVTNSFTWECSYRRYEQLIHR